MTEHPKHGGITASAGRRPRHWAPCNGRRSHDGMPVTPAESLSRDVTGGPRRAPATRSGESVPWRKGRSSLGPRTGHVEEEPLWNHVLGGEPASGPEDLGLFVLSRAAGQRADDIVGAPE